MTKIDSNHSIRCSDVVIHTPSGEEWLVAYADYSCDEISACGWPDSTAKISDCVLVAKATDEQHFKLLGELIASCGRRGKRAEAIYRPSVPETNQAAKPQPATPEAFQSRVQPWMMACFGPVISGDKLERGDRLLEEVLELLQSGDYPKERAYALIEYVDGRPKGEPAQEAGGVMVTLAAYCLAHDLDMHAAGETELARIWTKVEQIRAKQAAKPTGSALPVAVQPAAPEVVACPVCRGTGKIEQPGCSAPHRPCGYCGGTGKQTQIFAPPPAPQGDVAEAVAKEREACIALLDLTASEIRMAVGDVSEEQMFAIIEFMKGRYFALRARAEQKADGA